MNLSPVKAWLKAEAPMLVLIALAVLASAIMLLTGYQALVGMKTRADAKTVAAAPVKAAEAGQALAQDAVKTLDDAGRRDRLTLVVQQENARAIREAPGADAPVDPELGRRMRVGLCRYAAYAADPGCVEVRGRDPAVLP